MTPFTEKKKQHVALKKRPPLTLAYIQISPEIRETENFSQREKLIERMTGGDIFAILTETVSGMTSWKNRGQLQWMVESLKKGDRLVVCGFSELGRSISDILALLSLLHQRGVKIHDVKNKRLIDERVPEKTLDMMEKISCEIDHEVISRRVTEGLAVRRAKGLPVGRKKGSRAKSKLDAHKNEIISLLKSGSTKAFIIKKFETSKTNLYHWLKQNDLETIVPVYKTDTNGSG